MSIRAISPQSQFVLATVNLLALVTVTACSGESSNTTSAPSKAEAGAAAGRDSLSDGSPGGAGGAGGAGLGGTSNGGRAVDGGRTSSGGSAATGAAAGSGGGGTTGSNSGELTSETLYVEGRFLRDRCGQKLVLRGVNEMIVWSSGKDGVPEFAEIAKTGANAVRIVWTNEGTAAELDAAISNAIEQELIPMVEHHGATGDFYKIPWVVDYWTSPDVVSVLKKHSAYLLLNIANEAGADVTQQTFQSGYEQAITRIRDAGITVPLVIDAPGWGGNIDMLQAAGPALIDHDPERNVLFSVHMWWSDSSGDRVKAELEQSVRMDLPLIVGEFAQHAFTGCANSPFNYQVLLDEAQKHEIGWLAWSWGSVNNNDCAGQGSFDMTTNGTFGEWEETWGSDVALAHPNSIQNTSVRPASLTEDRCTH